MAVPRFRKADVSIQMEDRGLSSTLAVIVAKNMRGARSAQIASAAADPVRYGYMEAIMSPMSGLASGFGDARRGKKQLAVQLPLSNKRVHLIAYVPWKALADLTLRKKRNRVGANRFWLDKGNLLQDYTQVANAAADYARRIETGSATSRKGDTVEISVAYSLPQLPDPLDDMVRRAFLTGDQKAAEGIREYGTPADGELGLQLLGILEYGRDRRPMVLRKRATVSTRSRLKTRPKPSRRKFNDLPPRPFVRQLSARIGQEARPALQSSFAKAVRRSFSAKAKK